MIRSAPGNCEITDGARNEKTCPVGRFRGFWRQKARHLWNVGIDARSASGEVILAKRDAMKEGLVVGVIGAGAMGRGIAQVAAQGGCAVKIFDAKEGAADKAKSFIEGMFERAVEKGRLADKDAKAAKSNLSIADQIKQFSDCEVVIEVIIESLEVKHAVFKELEEIVSADCILASNTSSLAITSIARVCRSPGRVAGMHFFNPVPLMKLVEVIEGTLTDPDVTDFLMDLGTRMNRTPVRCKDAPGFLVNQVGRGYAVEAHHALSEGATDYFTADRIFKDQVGFRMGPFELMDLTGIDVAHAATEAIYHQFYEEARYRPNEIMSLRKEAGLLGRKVGEGHYRYPDGKQELLEEDQPGSFDGRPVWVSHAEPEMANRLTTLLKGLEVNIEEGDRPSSGAIILTTPLGNDATASALEEDLDATRTLAVDCLFSMEKRRVLMKTPVTDTVFANQAWALMASDGAGSSVICDSPGFLAQRCVALICNIGCQIAQQRTASPEDVDVAVVLGLNYPLGPLSFGDTYGAENILKVLVNMQRITGDQRYRPSAWLRRRAALGVSLLTTDS